MIFEGTKFEKLESSIKNEINRKRQRGSSAVQDSCYATEKKRTKTNRGVKDADAPENKAEELSGLSEQDVTKASSISKQDITKASSLSKPQDMTKASSLSKQGVMKASSVSKEGVIKASNSGPISNDEYSNDRTVYVQGLPFTSTEEDIYLFFKDVGQIVSIRLPKWHDSGKVVDLQGLGGQIIN